MLIVNRGSRISAIGTPSQPIIFTGIEDIQGTANPETSDRLWGGVIILGRAPIRGCNTAVAQGTVDCQNAVEGVTAATGRDALYGGATPTDASGTLRYVQIRYPGAFLTSAAAGDDLNGLTLGGVGSGTDISFTQIHNSGDDGVEIFGGTVNMKNIIISGALDDGLDTDEGWQGNVQFLAMKQTVGGRTGGPESPPITLPRRGLRVSVSIAMARKVLATTSASAPASSAARAISAMSVTLGVTRRVAALLSTCVVGAGPSSTIVSPLPGCMATVA